MVLITVADIERLAEHGEPEDVLTVAVATYLAARNRSEGQAASTA